MISNLDLYKVFYACAKENSFSLAAKELFVTQSSISQSIKALESELNTELFLRNGKRITLSKEGQYLKDSLNGIFSSFINIEKDLKGMNNLEIGEITIGASDTICKYYLLDGLKKFKDRYPNIKLHIENKPSYETMINVEYGILDIGFASVSKDIKSNNLEFDTFINLNEVFVYNPKKFQIPSHIDLETLIDYPIISLKKNTNTRAYLDKLFKNNGLDFNPSIELISNDLIVELVKIGFGIGFIDLNTIRKEIENSTLKTIDISNYEKNREIAIVRTKKRPMSKLTTAFIECF
jgi:DNA-binding transcriptional LysR family regulator